MNRYKKPKLWRASSLIVGESLRRPNTIRRRPSKVQGYAKELQKRKTPAEKRFEIILNGLDNGVLRDRFFTQWPLNNRWIFDLFFYENRLAIEVDGSIHGTKEKIVKDREKNAGCKEWGITLLRIQNSEVFGDKAKLIEKFRRSWERANKTIQGSAFAVQKPNIIEVATTNTVQGTAFAPQRSMLDIPKLNDSEKLVIQKYGSQFADLIDGTRVPRTIAQRRFIKVCKGDVRPNTFYEDVGLKYQKLRQVRLDLIRRIANDKKNRSGR